MEQRKETLEDFLILVERELDYQNEEVSAEVNLATKIGEKLVIKEELEDGIIDSILKVLPTGISSNVRSQISQSLVNIFAAMNNKNGQAKENAFLKNKDRIINTYQLAEQNYGGDHETIVGWTKALHVKRIIDAKQREVSLWKLTQEGFECCTAGSPEFRVLQCILDASGIKGVCVSTINEKDNGNEHCTSLHSEEYKMKAAIEEETSISMSKKDAANLSYHPVIDMPWVDYEDVQRRANIVGVRPATVDHAINRTIQYGWTKVERATKLIKPLLNNFDYSSQTGLPLDYVQLQLLIVQAAEQFLKSSLRNRSVPATSVPFLFVTHDTCLRQALAVLSLRPGPVSAYDQVHVESSQSQNDHTDNSKYVVDNSESSVLQDLKRRKLVEFKKIVFYEISRGPNFKKVIRKTYMDLTQEMLLNNSWEEAEFKPYNFFAAGKRPQIGSLHPLTRYMNFLKKILLSMGFEEMETNRWVDSSFWCFDALFMPQQHPSRDVQDTFFLKHPEYTWKYIIPNDYMEKVKEVHEVGNCYDSVGWNYKWSEKEALKCVLRTHTTAVSAKVLYSLGQEYIKTQKFEPKKYFSIDRVFRNENLDSTHLAEFHQVEGILIDKNVGLSHLKGVLKTFYKKIGIEKIRFKPAYNPYTAPSMEIYGFHPTMKRWIEVGNSGVFRPEMIYPMGFSHDVNVIAWGLSLERPAMIHYGIDNIRDLFGHKAVISNA